MKRKVVFSLIYIILCLVVISPIHAEDSDLNLNTEDLKNKEDNYSSLTDINGMNLFTSETHEIILIEDSKQKKEFSSKIKILFTNQSKVSKEQNTSLFSNPVSFDKTLQNEEKDLPINSIIFLLTIVFGSFVFVLTRKYYKNKEEKDSEINFNVYK